MKVLILHTELETPGAVELREILRDYLLNVYTVSSVNTLPIDVPTKEPEVIKE